MFLSSRWGKPAYEIDLLPTSEFIRQKVFWEKFKWGQEDDMSAMIMSQVLGIRSGKPPSGDDFNWKDLALDHSGKKIRTLASSNPSAIRRGFMAIRGALSSLAGKK